MRTMLDELRQLDVKKRGNGRPAQAQSRPPVPRPRQPRRYLAQSAQFIIADYGDGEYHIIILGRRYVLSDGRLERRITGRRYHQIAEYLIGHDHLGTLHAHFLRFVQDIHEHMDMFHRWLDRLANALNLDVLGEALSIMELKGARLRAV